MGDLTLQLLEWVAERPRTYAASIEAWKSNCPRLSVWDDAVIDGLIRTRREGSEPLVELTPAGRALLDARPDGGEIGLREPAHASPLGAFSQE